MLKISTEMAHESIPSQGKVSIYLKANWLSRLKRDRHRSTAFLLLSSFRFSVFRLYTLLACYETTTRTIPNSMYAFFPVSNGAFLGELIFLCR